PLSDAFHFLFLGTRTSRTKIPSTSKSERVNFIPASRTLSLQKTERRGWGTCVVGTPVRRFSFFVFGGANKSHQDSKQIKVRDGQLHSGISHPVSPKN